MPSSKNFFIALQKFVNGKDLLTLYYNEAKKNAPFPYGVISDPNESLLKYGNQVFFDILIWSKDPITGVKLEEITEQLIALLDRHIFSEQRAVIYFESQKPVSDPEFELVKKKLTFSVRIF